MSTPTGMVWKEAKSKEMKVEPQQLRAEFQSTQHTMNERMHTVPCSYLTRSLLNPRAHVSAMQFSHGSVQLRNIFSQVVYVHRVKN